MRGRDMFGPVGVEGGEGGAGGSGGCCKKRPAALFEGAISSDDIAQGMCSATTHLSAAATCAVNISTRVGTQTRSPPKKNKKEKQKKKN